MSEAEALQLAVEAALAAQAAAESAAQSAADRKPDWWLPLLEHLPALLFLLIVLTAALFNFRRLGSFLDRVSGVKAMGVEIALEARKELMTAVSVGDEVRILKTVSGKDEPVRIPTDDSLRVLQRAARAQTVLKGRRILWLDDQPSNNAHEIYAFQQLGLIIHQVQTNTDALVRLQYTETTFDVVLTDIKRPGGEPDGLDFLNQCLEFGIEKPVIFYITEVVQSKPNPRGCFGLTNRPDELLHLVIDALERVHPLDQSAA